MFYVPSVMKLVTFYVIEEDYDKIKAMHPKKVGAVLRQMMRDYITKSENNG